MARGVDNAYYRDEIAFNQIPDVIRKGVHQHAAQPVVFCWKQVWIRQDLRESHFKVLLKPLRQVLVGASVPL